MQVGEVQPKYYRNKDFFFFFSSLPISKCQGIHWFKPQAGGRTKEHPMVNRGEPCKSQSSKVTGTTDAWQPENTRPKFSACVQERWDQGWDLFSPNTNSFCTCLHMVSLHARRLSKAFTEAWKESCLYTPALPFQQLFSETANAYNTGENQRHFEPKRLTKATVSKSSRCPGGGKAP